MSGDKGRDKSEASKQRLQGEKRRLDSQHEVGKTKERKGDQLEIIINIDEDVRLSRAISNTEVTQDLKAVIALGDDVLLGVVKAFDAQENEVIYISLFSGSSDRAKRIGVLEPNGEHLVISRRMLSETSALNYSVTKNDSISGLSEGGGDYCEISLDSDGNVIILALSSSEEGTTVYNPSLNVPQDAYKNNNIGIWAPPSSEAKALLDGENSVIIGAQEASRLIGDSLIAEYHYDQEVYRIQRSTLKATLERHGSTLLTPTIDLSQPVSCIREAGEDKTGTGQIDLLALLEIDGVNFGLMKLQNGEPPAKELVLTLKLPNMGFDELPICSILDGANFIREESFDDVNKKVFPLPARLISLIEKLRLAYNGIVLHYQNDELSLQTDLEFSGSVYNKNGEVRRGHGAVLEGSVSQDTVEDRHFLATESDRRVEDLLIGAKRTQILSNDVYSSGSAPLYEPLSHKNFNSDGNVVSHDVLAVIEIEGIKFSIVERKSDSNKQTDNGYFISLTQGGQKYQELPLQKFDGDSCNIDIKDLLASITNRNLASKHNEQRRTELIKQLGPLGFCDSLAIGIVRTNGQLNLQVYLEGVLPVEACIYTKGSPEGSSIPIDYMSATRARTVNPDGSITTVSGPTTSTSDVDNPLGVPTATYPDNGRGIDLDPRSTNTGNKSKTRRKRGIVSYRTLNGRVIRKPE